MGLITTNEARCRDCYRCLRGCAVKAIRFSAGDQSGVLHARVIDDLCVHDARCVLSCPQKAKTDQQRLPGGGELDRESFSRPFTNGCQAVFIGPCAAKKGEAKTEGIDDAIDYLHHPANYTGGTGLPGGI